MTLSAATGYATGGGTDLDLHHVHMARIGGVRIPSGY
jgi:hypothetical protein